MQAHEKPYLYYPRDRSVGEVAAKARGHYKLVPLWLTRLQCTKASIALKNCSLVSLHRILLGGTFYKEFRSKTQIISDFSLRREVLDCGTLCHDFIQPCMRVSTLPRIQTSSFTKQYIRGVQMFRKCRDHLIMMCARRVAWSNTHIERSQILGVTVNWRPGFAHPWNKWCWNQNTIHHLREHRG
jgi:hypothetical protein